MNDHNNNGNGNAESAAACVVEPTKVEQVVVHEEKSAVVAPPPVEKEKVLERKHLLSRLIYRLSSMSVRYKIAGTLLIVLSTAVVSLGVATFTRQNAILRSELNNRATILVQQLSNVGKEGLLTKEELPVFASIKDIQKGDDVVYAMILDDEGRVFAHSDMSKKGTVLADPFDMAASKANTLTFQETTVNNDIILDATTPIHLNSKNLKLGVARIGLSEKALSKSIRNQRITYIWIALVFVATGLLVSFALARVLTRPLDLLADGIQVVTRGDLRRLVAVRYDDEIGKLTGAFNQMIQSLREKLLMEKYLSQSTVLNIKENRDVTQLKLGGERKYVTALFSDARGFTALSEKMSPEEVVSLMNIYLNLQTTVIHQRGGIVDKFVGDEVMAIFEGRGMEINAVRAAVEIQNYLRALNAARAASGEKQVNVGIGLNSGEVVMGNMGSEDHMDYTVIGDCINVAARLCGVAQPGQVLVTKIIYDVIGDQATWKEMPPVLVKGKEQPIGIAEPMVIKGGARRYMRKATDVSVTYTLEGFSDESNDAMVKNISASGCLLEVSGPLAIGSKMSINFNLVELGNITVRATVYHARKQERAYYVGLCFEGLQVEIQHRIIQWIHQVNSEIVPGLFL
jgi:class 3 adenylate cyclase